MITLIGYVERSLREAAAQGGIAIIHAPMIDGLASAADSTFGRMKADVIGLAFDPGTQKFHLVKYNDASPDRIIMTEPVTVKRAISDDVAAHFIRNGSIKLCPSYQVDWYDDPGSPPDGA